MKLQPLANRFIPNAIIEIVQRVVWFKFGLEPWNIVQHMKSSRQVGEACDDAKNREQSSASIHVEEAAAGGHAWDIPESTECGSIYVAAPSLILA